MRVVLDANVWVSALIQAGPSQRIVMHWLAGSNHFEVVICPMLINEITDVLTRRPRMRKWVNIDIAQRLIETIQVLADVVPNPQVIEPTTRDVNDDYLVALARENSADYIVTGDKDLLECLEQQSPVITPLLFEKLIEK